MAPQPQNKVQRAQKPFCLDQAVAGFGQRRCGLRWSINTTYLLIDEKTLLRVIIYGDYTAYPSVPEIGLTDPSCFFRNYLF